MLELRPNCECCDVELPADREGAFICSFECTFCSPCREALDGRCPNCGGGLVGRPLRSAQLFDRHPPGRGRKRRAEPCPFQAEVKA